MIAVAPELERPRTDAENPADMDLARRVASGDERALEELYERFADPLFAFIYHSLDGNRPDAEEVWQDTLSACIRALPSYRGQSRLLTWVWGVARHKLADRRRGQERRNETLFSLPPDELAELIDAGPLPEQILAQRATCARVAEVLGQLPSEYRMALAIRYADGQSVQTVARVLGKTYKAAESTLSRAREAFRQALGTDAEVQL